MKVIAIVNEKGGVGKTATATSLSYLLARLGKRVCLIDFDGQGHSSIIFGVKNKNQLKITVSTLLRKIMEEEELPKLNVDDWVEMELFAEIYEEYLKKYIELKNGIPSHDTITRVMGRISPEALQQLYSKWQELLNRNEGEKLKKIICIDGKTMRSNGNEKQKVTK